ACGPGIPLLGVILIRFTGSAVLLRAVVADRAPAIVERLTADRALARLIRVRAVEIEFQCRIAHDLRAHPCLHFRAGEKQDLICLNEHGRNPLPLVLSKIERLLKTNHRPHAPSSRCAVETNASRAYRGQYSSKNRATPVSVSIAITAHRLRSAIRR